MKTTVVTLEGGGMIEVMESPETIDKACWSFDDRNRKLVNESERQRFILLTPPSSDPEAVDAEDLVRVRPRSIVAIQRIVVQPFVSPAQMTMAAPQEPTSLRVMFLSPPEYTSLAYAAPETPEAREYLNADVVVTFDGEKIVVVKDRYATFRDNIPDWIVEEAKKRHDGVEDDGPLFDPDEAGATQ